MSLSLIGYSTSKQAVEIRLRLKLGLPETPISLSKGRNCTRTTCACMKKRYCYRQILCFIIIKSVLATDMVEAQHSLVSARYPEKHWGKRRGKARGEKGRAAEGHHRFPAMAHLGRTRRSCELSFADAPCNMCATAIWRATMAARIRPRAFQQAMDHHGLFDCREAKWNS